jgi:serine/threonine protein phosphatase PrpC
VFDGHRGADVAQMCAVQFPIALRQSLRAKKDMEPMKALVDAFQDMNDRIRKMKMMDGATAAVALIRQETITLAHVGDARAILFCLDPEDEEKISSSLTTEDEVSARETYTFSKLKTGSDDSLSTSSTSSASLGRNVSTKAIKMQNGRSGFMISTIDHTAKNRGERRRVDDLGG